jgi:hypothetical protein
MGYDVLGAALPPIAQSPQVLPHLTTPTFTQEIAIFSNRICSEISAEFIETKIRITDAQLKKTIADHIQQLRESSPFIKNMIDFVFAYNTNFTIQQYPCRIDTNKPVTFAGYDLLSNIMVLCNDIPSAEIGNYDPMRALRHEFRHAYCATLLTYSLGESPYLPSCFYTNNPEVEEKVRHYLILGDRRVDILAQQLSSNWDRLDRETQMKLQKLELTLQKHQKYYPDDLYDAPFSSEVGQFLLRKNARAGDLITTPSQNQIKVVSVDKVTGVYKTTISNNPLLSFVESIRNDQIHVHEQYHQSQYLIERDAYLIEHAAPPLLEAYYPEYIQYLARFHQKKMVSVHPGDIPPGYHQYAHEFSSDPKTLSYLAFKDHYLLENLLRNELDSLMHAAAMLLSGGNLRVSKPSLGSKLRTQYNINFDQIEFVLQKIIQRMGGSSLEKKARINQLLGNLASQKLDGLGACRYFHRAFKQGAEFTIQDYQVCTANLIENHRQAEARQIIREALRRHKAIFSKIPASYTAALEDYKKHQIAPLEELMKKITLG